NRVKASAFRRWPVTLGLIARVQTTRWTGGHDFNYLKFWGLKLKLKPVHIKIGGKAFIFMLLECLPLFDEDYSYCLVLLN
ncbi:MAG: hypothetical protein E6147_09750, partial [Peptostreptococcus sp.]|uniref:hypothetical protein n=1 Tax=Peptostreptococcus sp. TaxID=1262 RepID=UPI0029073D48